MEGVHLWRVHLWRVDCIGVRWHFDFLLLAVRRGFSYEWYALLTPDIKNPVKIHKSNFRPYDHMIYHIRIYDFIYLKEFGI